jgi:hypothetical protein
MGRVFDGLPEPVRGAADVQRVLNVDRALGWQLFRLVSATDPLSIGADVPRPAPVAKALRNAEAKGVASAVINEARTSFEEFERLVERHAGDRASFDCMARGLAEEAVATKERRAAYRANAAIWGVQAQTYYSLAAMHLSEDGQSEDGATVRGYFGLRKLRSRVPEHVLHQFRTFWSTTAKGLGETTPAARRSVEVMERFSDRPAPPLRYREVEPGRMEVSLNTDVVGRAGEVTYLLREVARSVCPHLPMTWWGSWCPGRIPTEVLVSDMLVPAGWSDSASIQVGVYSNIDDRAALQREEDRLAITETVAHLGQDFAALRTPYVPRCPEIAQELCRQMGWGKTRFDIYRCVVQYPVLSSGLVMRVEPSRVVGGEDATRAK